MLIVSQVVQQCGKVDEVGLVRVEGALDVISRRQAETKEGLTAGEVVRNPCMVTRHIGGVGGHQQFAVQVTNSEQYTSRG